RDARVARLGLAGLAASEQRCASAEAAATAVRHPANERLGIAGLGSAIAVAGRAAHARARPRTAGAEEHRIQTEAFRPALGVGRARRPDGRTARVRPTEPVEAHLALRAGRRALCPLVEATDGSELSVHDEHAADAEGNGDDDQRGEVTRAAHGAGTR